MVGCKKEKKGDSQKDEMKGERKKRIREIHIHQIE